MNNSARPVTLIGGPHHGDTVVIPTGLQAVVDLGPNSTAAQLITVTYTVHPRLPYAAAPGVDLGDYVHLRDALAKLKPAAPRPTARELQDRLSGRQPREDRR